MPVPFVTCQHEITGAFADLPETAVQHMPGWEPVGKPQEATVSELPEQPTPKTAVSSPAGSGPATPGETGPPAQPAPTKRKAAAESAKTPEED